jgi:hypothetical protein
MVEENPAVCRTSRPSYRPCRLTQKIICPKILLTENAVLVELSERTIICTKVKYTSGSWRPAGPTWPLDTLTTQVAPDPVVRASNPSGNPTMPKIKSLSTPNNPANPPHQKSVTRVYPLLLRERNGFVAHPPNGHRRITSRGETVTDSR